MLGFFVHLTSGISNSLYEELGVIAMLFKQKNL